MFPFLYGSTIIMFVLAVNNKIYERQISMINRKYLVTDELNRLAKALRILGYDAKVIKSISLLNLIRLAQKEGRTVLTRNKKIARDKHEFKRVLIVDEDYENQLGELVGNVEINQQKLFSRCSECNRELAVIDKVKIEGMVPAKVYDKNEEYKICFKCGRVYWRGDHYKEILAKITKALVIPK